MANVARKWVRRNRGSSSKDNNIDEAIWDRNDAAFLEEVIKSRKNSMSSSAEASFSVPTHTATTAAVGPSSRRPSASATGNSHYQPAQQVLLLEPPPVFRMPFQSATASQSVQEHPAESTQPDDPQLRRPSAASTIVMQGSQSPRSGATTPASRNSVLANLKRMVSGRRTSSKRSDNISAGIQSLQTSPTMSRRSLALSRAGSHPDDMPNHFSALAPPGILRTKPDERTNVLNTRGHEPHRTLGSAIDDLTLDHAQQRQHQGLRARRFIRNRQGSAPALHFGATAAGPGVQPLLRSSGPLPLLHHQPLSQMPPSPRSRFTAWQERGSFSSGPGTVRPFTADVSPTREAAPHFSSLGLSHHGAGTQIGGGWTLASPPPATARRRTSSQHQLYSPLSMMSPTTSSSIPTPAPRRGPVPGSGGGGALGLQYQQRQHSQLSIPDHHWPVRPRRSADLLLQLEPARTVDQEIMAAFNAAHERRWSVVHQQQAQQPRWRRRSETAHTSTLFGSAEAVGSGPGPGPGAGDAARFGVSGEMLGLHPHHGGPGPHLTMSTAPSAVPLTRIHSVVTRRRSFTPFDGKRLSIMFPSLGGGGGSGSTAGTTGAGAGRGSCPVTPSSISRPLSVCSSTFDSLPTSYAPSSYAPSFATATTAAGGGGVEPCLPSPLTGDSTSEYRLGLGQTPGIIKRGSGLSSVSDLQEELEPTAMAASAAAPEVHQQHQHWIAQRSLSASGCEAPRYAPAFLQQDRYQLLQHEQQQHFPSQQQHAFYTGGQAAALKKRPSTGNSMLPHEFPHGQLHPFTAAQSYSHSYSHGASPAGPGPQQQQQRWPTPYALNKSTGPSGSHPVMAPTMTSAVARRKSATSSITFDERPPPQFGPAPLQAPPPNRHPHLRRPSFGLSVAPAAVAAFESIPAPSGSASSLDITGGGSDAAAEAGKGETEAKSASGVGPLARTASGQEHGSSMPASMGSMDKISEAILTSSSSSSSRDLISDESYRSSISSSIELRRRPLSDAPVTPDLDADVEQGDGDGFDFGQVNEDEDEDIDVDFATAMVDIEAGPLGFSAPAPWTVVQQGQPSALFQHQQHRLSMITPSPQTVSSVDDGPLEMLVDESSEEEEGGSSGAGNLSGDSSAEIPLREEKEGDLVMERRKPGADGLLYTRGPAIIKNATPMGLAIHQHHPSTIMPACEAVKIDLGVHPYPSTTAMTLSGFYDPLDPRRRPSLDLHQQPSFLHLQQQHGHGQHHHQHQQQQQQHRHQHQPSSDQGHFRRRSSQMNFGASLGNHIHSIPPPTYTYV